MQSAVYFDKKIDVTGSLFLWEIRCWMFENEETKMLCQR